VDWGVKRCVRRSLCEFARARLEVALFNPLQTNPGINLA